MANFKVLKHNQLLLSWIGIDSRSSNESKNQFFYSIIAHYFILVNFYSIVNSTVFACEHWPQFDIITQPMAFIFGATSCIGLILSVGLNMEAVKALHLKLQRIVDECKLTSSFSKFSNFPF